MAVATTRSSKWKFANWQRPSRKQPQTRFGVGPRRNSSLSEKCVEVRKHVGGVPLLEADEFAGDLAVAINYVGFRVHRSAVGLGDRRVVVFGGGIAVGREDYALVAEEFFVSGGVLVSSDAENDAIARLDVFLKAI